MTIHHYKEINFKADSLRMIGRMNAVIEKWQAEGYTLTVRQLYYQLVARALIENTERSYKNICTLVNNARLAGLMRWDAIEDRTREFIDRGHWDSPQDILAGCVRTYHMDMWENQQNRVFVIVEKEALVGILQNTCHKYDVPLLPARGYPSGTVLREFAVEKLMPAMDSGQYIEILHLGDHDPSGIDMSRDLEERLRLFCETSYCGTDEMLTFNRIALTMEQIDDQRPPPNPAKSTDARFKEYRKQFGGSSWELDALSPTFMNTLVERNIEQFIDDNAWAKRSDLIIEAKSEIARVAKGIKWEALE